jgi:hypothetical protein
MALKKKAEVVAGADVEAQIAILAGEKCDHCGTADGQVHLTGASGSKIVLCGHHYATHAERLMLDGWTILRDTRADLERREAAR